ncbi:EF-hand domain-containing protein [Kitasatospora sp. NPDC002040]|uniref:EF-hand domain-containing protein n=1 Tax=Kitasatospora sp. NPDC002040 TaxID=3154661 RepID=UPI0033164FFE
MTITASPDALDRKIDLCFGRADLDRDGLIDASDVLGLAVRTVVAAGADFDSPKAVAMLKASQGWWRALVADLDSNRDQKIQRHEYRVGMRLLAEAPGAFDDVLRPAALAVFRLMDRNEDGWISAAEFWDFQRAFGSSEAAARFAFEKLDTDRDGVLSEAELLSAFRGFYTSTDPDQVGNHLFGDALD